MQESKTKTKHKAVLHRSELFDLQGKKGMIYFTWLLLK